MFVSGYNTYIHPSTLDKNAKSAYEKNQPQAKKFDSKLLQRQHQLNNPNLPINYLSRAYVFNNKLELEFQKNKFHELSDKNLTKIQNNLNNFNHANLLLNVKSAYESNSVMFSLFKIPHISLNQIPTTDTKLPQEIQKAKEINLRNLMINTYIANDTYYQITA